MPTILLLFVLFLSFTLTHSVLTRRINTLDKLSIPSFSLQIPSNATSLIFPASLPLPVLSSLSLTFTTPTTFTATSPILPVSTLGTLRRHKSTRLLTFRFRFTTPNISILLLATRCSKTAPLYTVHGLARHRFIRPSGMRLERSVISVRQGTDALLDALSANPSGPALVGVVDHAKAAATVGLSLAPATVVAFGKPALGSVLWRAQAEIGIELPAEILIARSPLGNVYVAWNSASLLKRRFALGKPVDSVLEMIDATLAKLAGVAAGRGSEAFGVAGLKFDRSRLGKAFEGVVTVDGVRDAEMAFNGLVKGIEMAGPVNVAYKVEHDRAAESMGLETDGKLVRVVVFGNPMLGTGIMQSSFTAALDLPVKMAVWTDGMVEGKFQVGYTAPNWIGKRHGAVVPDILTGALDNFANVAVMAGN